MTLAGYRVDSCNGCGKAYLVGESHDRKKCAECASKQVASFPAQAGGQWSLLATNQASKRRGHNDIIYRRSNT